MFFFLYSPPKKFPQNNVSGRTCTTFLLDDVLSVELHRRYAELLADTQRGNLVYVVVDGNGGSRSRGYVLPLCVASLLPSGGQAAIVQEVPYKLAFLHTVSSRFLLKNLAPA